MCQTEKEKELRNKLQINRNERNEIVEELARELFVKFVGKNLVAPREPGSDIEVCIICRGNKFYVYDPLSKLVEPDEWDFNKIIDDLKHDDDIALDYRYVSDEEAIEFIRSIYQTRAVKAKELLNSIMSIEIK